MKYESFEPSGSFFMLNENTMLGQGDCITEMQKMESNTIDLTVTSPPYDNLRTYAGTLEWNFEIFKQVANELYRITKDGGVVVWVVKDSVKNGNKSLTSFKQCLHFQNIGFNVYDVMIYSKTSGCMPHKNRYKDSFEYMFVFSKGKPSTVNLIIDRKNKYAGTLTRSKTTMREKEGNLTDRSVQTVAELGLRYNIWEYATGMGNTTSDKIAFDHPAIFPESLANDHIISWSNEGDLVFDPFMGSGTTGKMAKLNNRRFIGIEKVPEYFEIAKKRVQES